MTPRNCTRFAAFALAALLSTSVLAWFPQFPNVEEWIEDVVPTPPPPPEEPPATYSLQPGVVNCGNLIYGNNKTSKCFSPQFLKQISGETNVVANPGLVSVQLESSELFNFPFAVMTGEGTWQLTDSQRENMRQYLQSGGFIIASAGCSSEEWKASFRSEIAQVFADVPLTKLDMSHPLFHTVYEIERLECKRADSTQLEGLEIDGKIVLIFSQDGLNDTGHVGGNCCCCGGDEIRNAMQVNVNLLAYALTH
jgi:hypothetical protein